MNETTLKTIWALENEFSPVKVVGVPRQIIKAGEEYGEICSAFATYSEPQLKVEIAHLLNVLFGLSTEIYRDPEELEQFLLNAIEGMALKWGSQK